MRRLPLTYLSHTCRLYNVRLCIYRALSLTEIDDARVK